jgi:small subunit ribosomal protein S6
MPLYEHVFLARQDVSPQQVDALMKEFAQVIEQGGGTVGKTEYWGLRSLAYKIKKNRKAHFALMNIDAPPAAVAEMERREGLSTDLIRFLTVRVDEHETEPSIQMRKSDRDERRGGDRDRGGRGGFRGDRDGFRGGRGGGFRADRDREGGRGEREGGPRGEREGGPRGERDGERGPRPPRPPRESTPGTGE